MNLEEIQDRALRALFWAEKDNEGDQKAIQSAQDEVIRNVLREIGLTELAEAYEGRYWGWSRLADSEFGLR